MSNEDTEEERFELAPEVIAARDKVLETLRQEKYVIDPVLTKMVEDLVSRSSKSRKEEDAPIEEPTEDKPITSIADLRKLSEQRDQ